MQNITNLSIKELKKLNKDTQKLLYEKILKQIEDNLLTETEFICSHCGSHNTKKAGFNEQNKQKYYCKECGKYMIKSRNTLMFSSKKKTFQWVMVIKSLLNGDSLKKSADKAGISQRPAFRWRRKIPYQKKEKRGISLEKVNITCALDHNNNTFIKVSDLGRITSSSLIRLYQDKIKDNSILVADSHRSYHKLVANLKVSWKKIPSKKKSIEEYSLEPINHLHALIKDFVYHYKRISRK